MGNLSNGFELRPCTFNRAKRFLKALAVFPAYATRKLDLRVVRLNGRGIGDELSARAANVFHERNARLDRAIPCTIIGLNPSNAGRGRGIIGPISIADKVNSSPIERVIHVHPQVAAKLPKIKRSGARLAMLLVGWSVLAVTSSAEESMSITLPKSSWAEWIEEDFPFFSSVLDARQRSDPLLKDNLSPRALILNLGGGTWVGFDTELLRVAAIWEGRGVTPDALAPRSYSDPWNKTDGKSKLPRPDKAVWLANGLYPGWQKGVQVSTIDPREPGPSKQEVGRGPLPEGAGRFRAIHLVEGGVELRYTLGEVEIVDRFHATGTGSLRGVQRQLRVDASTDEMLVVVATRAQGTPARVSLQAAADTVQLDDTGPVIFVRIAPHMQPVEFSVWLAPREGGGKHQSAVVVASAASSPKKPRWQQVMTTWATLSTAKEVFVIDDIALPLENPWRRNIRLADIQFFRDGCAAAVTIDGDVWMIDGLTANLDHVRWRRFASGLHEPLSLAIRNDELFVFDRNGLWRLRDTDGDGEADMYELFCNLFAQTSDTREFPNSMKLAPDGSFVIAKGGQRGATLAKDSGTVLRVAPDGRSVTTLGWGFRQPFVGVHPRTGTVTASDQEGNYVPATPIYVLEKNEFHGFLAGFLPVEEYPAPLANPLVWLPRGLNASGITQLWLTDARLGPLNDGLIHIGYSRPELFVVRLSERATRQQASVTSLTRDLHFAPLSGAVNPVDGQLYIAGLQIYAGTAERVSGLARLRYTGEENPLPREIVAMDKGVLLRFDVPLDPLLAVDPTNYRAARWNYRRTASYGSPHIRLDGQLGEDVLVPSSVYLSRDHRNVFLGVPNMRSNVMQMEIGWSLATAKGTLVRNEAFLTPYELGSFIPEVDGFDDVVVDLTPRKIIGKADTGPLTAADGRKLATTFACVACHSTDGSKLVGPTWKGLPGSLRRFKDGRQAVADDSYLRESILFSSSKIVEGFDEGMPAYAGILNDRQIDALILYIKSI